MGRRDFRGESPACAKDVGVEAREVRLKTVYAAWGPGRRSWGESKSG